MKRPDYSTSPDYYHYYFDLSFGMEDLLEGLKKNCEDLVAFFQTIPEEKFNFRYADGKWSLKEVLMHIIETERILAYRALSFSRFDETNLPGFDENKFILHSNTNSRSYASLLTEFISIRTANLTMFSGFSDEMFDFQGSANNTKTTARGIAWFIIGHAKHHSKVIQERYI